MCNTALTRTLMLGHEDSGSAHGDKPVISRDLAYAFAAGNGVLRVRAYGDAPNMDPAHSVGVTEEEVHAAIYNKLIQYKPGREWDWQLDAASMIEQVDPTHIKFALRDDIGFTNGFGAMSAEDVKFSFERIVADATESPNKPDMGP